MAQQLLLIVLISIIGYACAIPPSYNVHTVEERRAEEELKTRMLVEESPYEYQAVSANDVALAAEECDSASSKTSIIPHILLSVWEALPIPSPFAAVKKIVFLVLKVGKWVLSKGGLVLLGGALATGFCAFTSFCSLAAEKPLSTPVLFHEIPYLENAEQYYRQAYNKYQ